MSAFDKTFVCPRCRKHIKKDDVAKHVMNHAIVDVSTNFSGPAIVAFLGKHYPGMTCKIGFDSEMNDDDILALFTRQPTDLPPAQDKKTDEQIAEESLDKALDGEQDKS